MLPNFLVEGKLNSLTSMLVEAFEISTVYVDPFTINTAKFQIGLNIA